MYLKKNFSELNMNHGFFVDFNFPKMKKSGPPNAAQGDPPCGWGGPLPSKEMEQVLKQ